MTRRLEFWLDVIAIVAGLIYLILTLTGVLSLAATGWPIGFFTGWLLRHLLHRAGAKEADQ